MRTPVFPPAASPLSDDKAVSTPDEVALTQEPGTVEVIPIAEEEVRVEKMQVTTGRVRVRTIVEVVQEPVHASLEEETVEVTRVPVGREIDQVPEVRTENGVTIVPVVEEVLVVEKRLILKEELHIRRNTHTEDVEIPVELRKQRAEVERLPVEDEDS